MNDAGEKDSKTDKKESVEEIKKPLIRPPSKEKSVTKEFVNSDNIRKELNDIEKRIQRNWSSKYNHLTGEFFKKILAEECAKAGIPVDTFERKLPEDQVVKSPFPLKPSPIPIPRTSSAFVGWRSSRREHNLEFFGRLHISARHTIEPPLLPGEFRVTQQKFLFLG